MGTFCLVLLVTQKFFGIPIASVALRHLARQLREDGEFVRRNCEASEEAVQAARKKPLAMPSVLDKPSVYLAKLGWWPPCLSMQPNLPGAISITW